MAQTHKQDKVSKFQFLDPLRGFFAMIVVVGHLQYVAPWGPWGIVDFFHTHIGVFGFFILSSFLLTYRMFSEFTNIVSDKGKTVCNKVISLFSSTTKFAIRRITRIQPLFIVVAAAIKYGPPFTFNVIHGLPDNFWHILFLYDTGTNVTWTIHIEMTYYLFVPFVCLFAALCGKRFRALVIISFIAIAIYSDYRWTRYRCDGLSYGVCYNDTDTYFDFTSWISVFCCGTVTALVYYWMEQYAQTVSKIDVQYHSQQHVSEINIFESILTFRVRNFLNYLCYLLSVVFILLVSKRWSLLSYLFTFHELKLYNYPAYHWSMVLFLALISRGSFTEIFNNKFWNHAGKVSYSIYLTHYFYLTYLQDTLKIQHFNGFEGFTIYIFLVMISATVTYYVIEYPGIWVGTKLCCLVDNCLT